jgi:septal ring factor EnvC (AmiA/AmiB activator)
MNSAIINILRPITMAMGLVVLYGCASVPAPVQELEVATAALASARAEGAPEHAADQWQRADDKLATARQMLERKQHRAARRALQQATVDAKLAQAQARMRQRDDEQRALQEELSQLQKRIEAVELAAE